MAMRNECPTEVQIPDTRENEIGKLGFLPRCHYKNNDFAVFFGAQTAQMPQKYEGKDGADATANAAISARLPYIMATSRIAHYLKCIARDRIGSFMEKEDCQKWLHNWIHNYVYAGSSPDDIQKPVILWPKLKSKCPTFLVSPVLTRPLRTCVLGCNSKP